MGGGLRGDEGWAVAYVIGNSGRGEGGRIRMGYLEIGLDGT